MEHFKKINETFFVSNLGRVYNADTKKFIKISYVNKNRGYKRVFISGKSRLLHRLVAELFCEKKEGCNIIHHKDNNPENNCADNLIWTTQSYNVRQAYIDGLCSSRKGINNPNYKNGKYIKQD